MTNCARPTRRGVLTGAGAMTAAGWAAVSGGWVLRPGWANAASDAIRMGIATNITGAIKTGGNTTWQTAQYAVSQINAAGGIDGRPIELVLEDTASDPATAPAKVRRLVQEANVDVVLGGITSRMREAIRGPIVNEGGTLYLYPQLYEGGDCTRHLFCTGPTAAQQCARLLPHLIHETGAKRFALPGANYGWPRALNAFAREVIEANGAEVVMESYFDFPLDGHDYAAVAAEILSQGVDHVFNTLIPPGLQKFTAALYEAGYYDGGTQSCVYFDENSTNFVAPRELEGVYSCLDFFHSVADDFTRELIAGYDAAFPDTSYRFTAGAAAGGTYRAVRFYEQAILATGGDLATEAISEAMQTAEIDDAPGGPARIVPGTGHTEMTMYIARAIGGQWEIISTEASVPPQSCG